MLDFMDHIQAAFITQSDWNVDNSYASLTTTAHNLLDFRIPQGLRLHVSSLSSPNFATSYTLGSTGVVDGSLSFLYLSLSVGVESKSRNVRLEGLVRGYRHLGELGRVQRTGRGWGWFSGNAAPTAAGVRKGGEGGVTAAGKKKENEEEERADALLYGRLYLPSSTLEALYWRRLSPTKLLRLNCVSDNTLPNGGSVLALLQNDHGKYSTEFLYSTDSALLGARGLYNFGYDPRGPASPTVQDDGDGTMRTPAHPWDHQNGRLSAGAEAYFSPVNKSGGISTGLRFATLPVHSGFPYTMTLTLNPLMGNLSSSYAVKAGANLALCSRFDFNVYSYESDVMIGMELWQRRQTPGDMAWAARMVRPGWNRAEDDVKGVLKARVDNKGRVGFLWECRLKELLVSVGAGLDLKKREQMLGRVGLEVSYSS